MRMYEQFNSARIAELSGEIGALARARMTASKDSRYDLARLMTGQRNNKVSELAPYESEISDQIANDLGRTPEPGFNYVPTSRDLAAGVASAGGFLVGTETAPGDVFVGALLANLRARRLGMQVIPMQGNGAIPRVSGSISTGWLSNEGLQLSESQLQIALSASTPKHVGGYMEISDQWLKQARAGAQSFVLTEMAKAVAAAVDTAITSGSGASGQPTGITETSGIGSVSGTSLSWAGVLDILHAVEDGNAVVNPQSLGWAMAPTVAKLLRGRERATGSGFMIEENRMAGYLVDSTNSVPAASCIFGDWGSVALLEWGALQIGIDPYGVNSALFKNALVGVRALYSIDILVLRPKSFCKSQSIT